MNMSVRLSLIWTYISQFIVFIITFSSSIVVARLLSPRDFGIFAMAAAVTTIINVLMQFGLAKYLMREPNLNRDMLRSLFTVNVLMSLLYIGSILVGSFAAGSILGSEDVGRFLLVFAFFPLFAMFEFIPAALCAREMRFGVIAVMSVLRAVIIAAITITFAWIGFAYMSFAWAQVLGWLATAIGFNIALWRPDVWRLRFAGMIEIFRFGTQMMGISGINQLSGRAGEMTLGSLLGLANLGLLTRASTLPNTLLANVFGAGSNVIFSRLSHDLRESGEFHENYFRFMRLLLGLLWPMMFGIAVLAQPVIFILYGAKWQAAATPMSLVTIATAITVSIGMTAEIFILRHRSQQQVRIEIYRAVFGYGMFAAGAMISLTMAAAAKIAEAAFAFFLYRKPMAELIGGPKEGLSKAYLEASFLTLIAVLPAFVLMLWTSWSPKTSLLLLAIAIALGVGGWAMALIKIRHPLYLECTRLLRTRL